MEPRFLLNHEDSLGECYSLRLCGTEF
ncbi:hypothetical protein, partial [Lactobacillus sp. 23-2]